MLRRTMLFNADTGAEGGNTNPAPEATPEVGATDANGGGQQPGQDAQKQPFAVFPDEASFMGRVSREAKKQVNELLKGLGIEKEAELKSILQSHRENIEKNKTDLEKAQEAANLATRERDEALNKANRILKTTEAKVQALASGIKPERLDYFLKLVDLESVEVSDGAVDVDSLRGNVEKVLKEFPELKGSQPAASKGGQDFNQGAANNFLTLEAIKNMSAEEAERRLPEIMEFLSKR